MTNKSLVAVAAFGWSTALLCAGYIFFSNVSASSKPKAENPASDALTDKPLTYADVEQSAIKKWKLQGFGRATKVWGPNGVPGKPGCEEFSYYLTKEYEVGVATARIVLCGKDVYVSDVQTLDQTLQMIKGR